MRQFPNDAVLSPYVPLFEELKINRARDDRFGGGGIEMKVFVRD